jgi:fatty-acyl-CoA synthase
MTTVADIFRQHQGNDGDALRFGDQTWSYRELVAEAGRRCALLDQRLEPGRPAHVGVLLDNVPDYLFWLTAGALSGSVIVGINSTYRGDQLGQLIRHTDCQLLVTAEAHAPLFAGVETGVASHQVLMVDSPEYAAEIAAQPPDVPDVAVTEEDLLLLIFTSGSTGLPKAVRCTQGRLARTGAHVANIADLSTDDAVYAPLPFFHSSSLFTGWSSSFNA